MWPNLPIEFYVTGTPVSHQSSNVSAKNEWKDRVLAAAKASLEEGNWSFQETRLSVSIFYFPQSAMTGDIDNIIKLTLDALMPNVYRDDELIDRVVAQRFDPTSTYTFQTMSAILFEAMASDDPALYVRIGHAPLEDIGT